MRIKNVHERILRTDRGRVAASFASLGTARDRIWPRGKWPALRLDAPKGKSGRGGHGPIRYRVVNYEPGRRIDFQFENSGLSKGLHGVHYFELEESGPGNITARHVIEARLGWPALLLWPVLIRPLHDALIEDAFDNFERDAADQDPAPRAYGAYVRMLRWLLIPREAGRPSRKRSDPQRVAAH